MVFPSSSHTLTDRFPDLEKGDVARFEKNFASDDGKHDEVIKNLEEYKQFRKMYDLDSIENAKAGQNDAADWKWASKLAIEAARSIETDLIPGLEGCPFEDRVCKLKSLPQILFAPQNKDGSPVLTESGNAVIQFLPARLDIKLASPEIYALCCTLYMERKAKNIDLDTVGAVMLADARQGAGWPNLKVLKIMGFLKILSNSLHKVHPGRLGKLIIFGVAYVAVSIFHVTKVFLPKAISENTTLINGGDGVKAPVPKNKLAKYVDPDAIDSMEETRLSLFNKND